MQPGLTGRNLQAKSVSTPLQLIERPKGLFLSGMRFKDSHSYFGAGTISNLCT